MVTQAKQAVADQSSQTAWVPTYSTDIGNAAASFTGGAVTTTRARAVQKGKMVDYSLDFNALTLGGVTPAYIKVSLPLITLGVFPANVVPFQTGNPTPAAILIGANWETGQVEDDGAGFLKFYRANRVVFPAGTTFRCSVKGATEVV